MLRLYPIVVLLVLLTGVGKSFGQGLKVVPEYTNENCGGPLGTITPHATGGTPPYAFQLLDPNGMILPQPTTGNTYTGLKADTRPYILIAMDGAGQQTFVTVKVGSGCITIPGVDQIAATCGNANGEMIIHESGGVAPVEYSIDGGKTFQASNTFSGIIGGLYNIVVKDELFTEATKSFIVGGIGAPSVTASATDASCNNNDGTVTAQGSGYALPLTYSIDSGAFGKSASFAKLASGDHVVQVHDNNGCIARYPITVKLNNTLVLKMPADMTICEGTSAPLAASSPNGISYQWIPATSLNNSRTLTPVASPKVTTNYTLTATWGACTQSGNVKVKVNAAPVAAVGPGDTTCYGKSAGLVGSGTGGTGTYTYKWSPRSNLDNPNAADPTVVRPTATTAYSLVVTDGNGCSSLNSAKETVLVLPPPPMFAGNDTGVVAGQAVPLHAVDLSNAGFITYRWTPATGLQNPDTSRTVLLSATESQTYTVTGTTVRGCQGVASITVKVFAVADIFVPNAFSPNHDGHNDVFRVIASSVRVLKVFAVYDRHGALVFHTTNPAEGWDGTRDGKELPPGTYVWMAMGEDWQGKKLEKKGTVVLVR